MPALVKTAFFFFWGGGGGGGGGGGVVNSISAGVEPKLQSETCTVLLGN